jgi:hypothetical protein
VRVNRCTGAASFAGTAVPTLTQPVAPDQPRVARAAIAGRMTENQMRLTPVQSSVSILHCNKVGTEPVVRSANRTSNPAPAGCPRGRTKGSGGDTNMTRAECTVDTGEKVASAGIQNEATSDVRARAQRRATDDVEVASSDVNLESRVDSRDANSFTVCVSKQCLRAPANGHGPLFPALGRFSENHPRKQAAGG